jgi:hypothetical protein
MPLRLPNVRSIVAAAALAIYGHPPPFLVAQGRGGNQSAARVVSPTVFASWASHWNRSDGTPVTLLVLWRGTPGWFSKGGSSSGSGSFGKAGPSGYSISQSFTNGGRTFELAFDVDREIVKILGQEVSLRAVNVILVDGADDDGGPRIVALQWVDPAPEDQLKGRDAIADAVRRTPGLFEYLQCHLELDNPQLNKMMALICDQMRP